jgi:hypothetical protein
MFSAVDYISKDPIHLNLKNCFVHKNYDEDLHWRLTLAKLCAKPLNNAHRRIVSVQIFIFCTTSSCGRRLKILTLVVFIIPGAAVMVWGPLPASVHNNNNNHNTTIFWLMVHRHHQPPLNARNWYLSTAQHYIINLTRTHTYIYGIPNNGI